MNPTSAIPPPRPLTEEVLTIPEIADLGGVTKAAVERWRLRTRTEIAKIDAQLADNSGLHDKEWRETRAQLKERRERLQERAFPVEDDYIGSIPVWRLDRLIPWFQLTSREYHEAKWRAKRKVGAYRKLHTGSRPRS